MITEAVKNVLMNNGWELATCADNIPNVVPIGFKNVTDDGKLSCAVVFMNKTLQNIAANPNVAVSAFDGATAEGYQVKGTAKFVTEGEEVEKFKAMAEALFKGAVQARGAIIIEPTKVYVTSPGPNNNKEL